MRPQRGSRATSTTGRERLADAARAHFTRRHGVDRAHQRRIPARGQGDGLRKTGGAHGGIAMQALLMEHDRNAEPGMLRGEALQGVHQPNRGTHVAARHAAAAMRGRWRPKGARTGRCRPGTCAPTSRHRTRDLHRIPRVLSSQMLLHLRDLLLESHARQQVLDPRLDRRRRHPCRSRGRYGARRQRG